MRRRLRARLVVLGVALSFLPASGCDANWQPNIAADEGAPAKFDQIFALELYAAYDKCPTPSDSRQRSNEYGPDWHLWVKFDVNSENQVEQIVNECLESPVPYSPAIWVLSKGQLPTAWGPFGSFSEFSLAPYAEDTQNYGIDDLHGTRVNRSIVVSRHTSDSKVFRVDVWITQIQ